MHAVAPVPASPAPAWRNHQKQHENHALTPSHWQLLTCPRQCHMPSQTRAVMRDSKPSVANDIRLIPEWNLDLEFSIIITFPAIYRLNHDQPVIRWWRKPEYLAKTTPHPKSLATLNDIVDLYLMVGSSHVTCTLCDASV